jgi:hypothetical protein
VQIMGPASRVADFKQIETTFTPLQGNLPLAGNLPFSAIDPATFVPALQQVRWPPSLIADTPDQAMARLFALPGSHYDDPEFSWKWAVAPAGIGFGGVGLGPTHANDLFVGEARTFLDNGYLFEFKFGQSRQHFAFDDPALADRVDDNDYKFDEGESKSLLAGENFGIVTDIQTGPDGNLYVTSLSNGAVYEITNTKVTNFPPTISGLRDVTVPPGKGSATQSFTVADVETPAAMLAVTATSSNTALLPASGIALGGGGADRTITVTPVPSMFGDATVTVTVTDAGGLTATDTFTVHVPPALGHRGLVGHKHFAAGGDEGSGTVSMFNADKSVVFSATPFPGFTGGVRTAVGDVNGDGVDDLIVGTGPGAATQVMVLDGRDGKTPLFTMSPFEASFTGGVFVAAGDVNGDGVDDIVITPDMGGGPRVLVIDGKTSAVLANFFGIDDPSFRGGARAALGDVNGDGVEDLVVAAGFQGGPRVAAFDGTTLRPGQTARKLFNDFFAFEQTLRNGVFLAVGDVDGDGKADIFAGGGPGGGPRVTAFSAKDLLASGAQTMLANFFAGDDTNRAGVRLAVKDLDGDDKADLVVGPGTGAGGTVQAFLGKDMHPTGTPPADLDFDALSGFNGGIFVG